MSRQVRQRVTAVLLGGLLLGAPLPANETVNAGRPSALPGHRSSPAQVTGTASTPSPSMPTPLGAIPATPSRTNLTKASKTRTRRGTGGSAPIVTGKSPSVRKASARRVPTRDLSAPAHPAPAAPAGPAPDVAAERVATPEPMPANGLIGLLAAVSMVLVLGVSAGVIRAIVSERASRTKIA